jgi:regulator of cell morphogenesis and NO signaling
MIANELDPNTRVGDLVAARPGRARVFERLGIDYCCGGKTPLARACREKGADVVDVLRQIAASDAENLDEDQIDWNQVRLGELADHIVSEHHGYLRRELPRLAGLMEKLIAAHGARHPELTEVRDTVLSLKAELDSHMLKEERVLFPIIKELESATALPSFHCGSVANPIGVMMHEHEYTGAALARLRSLTGGYQAPADGCETYRLALAGLAALEADLHRHIHKENEILFPRARAAEATLGGGESRSEL